MTTTRQDTGAASNGRDGVAGREAERGPGVSTERTWIAWLPNDGSRESARRYPNRYSRSLSNDAAGFVAEEHAEWEYANSAGECGNELVVNVIETNIDGTERAYSFDVYVGFEPTFSAYERNVQCCEQGCPDVATHFARTGDIP